jgi:hypothetical protein
VELLKTAQQGADEKAEQARAKGDKEVVHNPHFFRELAQRDHDFDAIRGGRAGLLAKVRACASSVMRGTPSSSVL